MLGAPVFDRSFFPEQRFQLSRPALPLRLVPYAPDRPGASKRSHFAKFFVRKQSQVATSSRDFHNGRWLGLPAPGTEQCLPAAAQNSDRGALRRLSFTIW